MRLKIQGIPTDEARRLRQGGLDAHGQPCVVRTAYGMMNPCRHCLNIIAEGRKKLVLAYRPFSTAQPYAETGPIFLHQEDCPHYESDSLPKWFDYLDPAIVRGYGEDDWIRYETGNVVRGKDLTEACRTILGEPTVAYVHIRSKFNCYQARVERA